MICNGVKIISDCIVGHETVMVSVDGLHHRANAGPSPIDAFQKTRAAHCVINSCPESFQYVLKGLRVFSKVMYCSLQRRGFAQP